MNLVDWAKWIKIHAHYCPHCPEDEQENVILVKDLRNRVWNKEED